MIRLSAAWRNTSVKRTTGTAAEAITSASTCPGPTEGSWSTSPTSISAACCGRAASTARISGTSTIEVSSTTSSSQLSGISSLRLNPPVRGSVSSRRWIVLASIPVLSDRRLAARPVGAQSATTTPLAMRILRRGLRGFGYFAFGVVEAREKDAPPLLDVIGNDCAFLQLKAECDVDQRGRHFEQ